MGGKYISKAHLRATAVAAKNYTDSKVTQMGTAGVVTVEKLASAVSGFAASYVVKQNNAQVGATINIPKDYLVKSAEIKVSTGSAADGDIPSGHKYIDFVVNTAEGSGTESHIRLDVLELVNDFTVAKNALQVQLAVSDTRELSATLVDSSVTEAKLAVALKNKINAVVTESAGNKTAIETLREDFTEMDNATEAAIKALQNEDKTFVKKTFQIGSLTLSGEKISVESLKDELGIANVEDGAQENVIEVISIGSKGLPVNTKNVDIPFASDTADGVMSRAQYAKLADIAPGATKVEGSTAGDGKIKINGLNYTVYTLPSDVVRDENYVRTENNFSTLEKNKLTQIAPMATADSAEDDSAITAMLTEVFGA